MAEDACADLAGSLWEGVGQALSCIAAALTDLHRNEQGVVTMPALQLGQA